MDERCIYCGALATDRDHVPPKNLFSRPRPTLVTVPSCIACNSGFGLDDEYLRDAIGLVTLDAADLPEAGALHDAMRRSLQREEFWPPIRQMLTEGRPIAAESTQYKTSVDMLRIGKTVARIVHALHFHHAGRVLPPANKPQIFHSARMPPADSPDLAEFQRVFAPLDRALWRSIGGRRFGYGIASVGSDPDSTVWALSFFAKPTFAFLACTIPPR